MLEQHHTNQEIDFHIKTDELGLFKINYSFILQPVVNQHRFEFEIHRLFTSKNKLVNNGNFSNRFDNEHLAEIHSLGIQSI